MWVCGRKKDRKCIFPTHYTSRDIITDMIHWHIKHICVMSLHECDLDDPSRLPLCTCVSVSRVKYTCAMCFLLWMRDLDCTSCFTTSHLQCVHYVCVCARMGGRGWGVVIDLSIPWPWLYSLLALIWPALGLCLKEINSRLLLQGRMGSQWSRLLLHRPKLQAGI